MKRGLLFAALLLLLLAGNAGAQETTPAPVSTPWSALTPDEQKVLAPLHDTWDQLPALKQQRLRRGAQRWDTLTPEQRAKVEERLDEIADGETAWPGVIHSFYDPFTKDLALAHTAITT